MALCTLSHELRTPIHIITNSLLIIKEKIGNNDSILTMYHKASTSAAAILLHKIDDLLDYSMIEQDKIKIEVSTFNIKELIIEFIQTFEYQARHR